MAREHSGSTNGRRARRAKRSSSSSAAAASSASCGNRGNSSNHDSNSNNHFGDDNRSTSSLSTFSGIRSILGRRRHIPELPAVQEHGREERGVGAAPADGSAIAAPLYGSKTAGPKRRSRPDGARKVRRRKPNSLFHSLLAVFLFGAASNRLATHIINSLFDYEIDGAVGGNQTAAYNQDPLLVSLNELSTEMERHGYTGHIQKQSQINQPKGRNDGHRIAGPRNEHALTKRFVNLRERLLALYSEDVPSDAATSSNVTTLHPLFNAQSAQWKALDWLANIDRRRLRHNDPGLIQRYALAVLYFATGGPAVTENTDLSRRRKGPWRNPTNFLAPTHECEWKSQIIHGAGRGGGIRRCDKNLTVVEISLYNELTGPIPSELGRLWNLRTLYLGRNSLTGTIPSELGMIQKLSSLSLQWNDLSGTIPAQTLTSLTTLRALQVEGNEKLSGKVERHSLLCQMRNNYRGPIPKGQERYNGKKVLRVFTATCIPTGGVTGLSDRLQCACCTECVGKASRGDFPHQLS